MLFGTSGVESLETENQKINNENLSPTEPSPTQSRLEMQMNNTKSKKREIISSLDQHMPKKSRCNSPIRKTIDYSPAANVNKLSKNIPSKSLLKELNSQTNVLQSPNGTKSSSLQTNGDTSPQKEVSISLSNESKAQKFISILSPSSSKINGDKLPLQNVSNNNSDYRSSKSPGGNKTPSPPNTNYHISRQRNRSSKRSSSSSSSSSSNSIKRSKIIGRRRRI